MADQKSWTEVFLMPVVVALVGFGGTYFITREQESSARIAGEAQIKSAKEQAAAERQIKLLDIFSEKITSSDTNQRILALKLLRTIEPDLAAKLALAVSEAEAPRSEVKQVAQQVAIESTARAAAAKERPIWFSWKYDILWCEWGGPEARLTAEEVRERLKQAGFSNLQTRVVDKAFLERSVRDHGYPFPTDLEADIRYFGDEREAAQYVKERIDGLQGSTFLLREVGTPTPGSLTIVICPGGNNPPALGPAS